MTVEVGEQLDGSSGCQGIVRRVIRTIGSVALQRPMWLIMTSHCWVADVSNDKEAGRWNGDFEVKEEFDGSSSCREIALRALKAIGSVSLETSVVDEMKSRC